MIKGKFGDTSVAFEVEEILDDKLSVLDHGHVRLVAVMGNDLSVVRAARVSYDADWRTGESSDSDVKLIRYLWRNKHTSPFEHVAVTYDVKAPIFVLRQWHRHRTQSYNEVSARYTVLPDEFYVPALDRITTQAKDNKQMSTDERHPQAEIAQAVLRKTMEDIFESYRALCEMEIPRELARIVLPVGTYSHMFVTMNLLNLFRFLGLREHQHAQPEIRVYAEAMRRLIEPHVPVCVSAFDEFGV